MHSSVPKFESGIIHVTGTDYPGILAEVTSALAQLEVKFLDVQQTTSLGQLSLSLLVSVEVASGLAVLKELNQLQKKLGVFINFSVLDKENISNLRKSNRKYVLSILAPQIPMSSFSAVAAIMGRNNINIERMNKLAHDSIECIELLLSLQNSQTDISAVKEEIFQAASIHAFDIAIQKEDVHRRSKRLIVMDMDSTLIQQEVIDEIADFAGIKKEVALITEQAMQGKIDFQEALRKRVSLLKGLDEGSLAKVIDRIQLTPGVEELVSTLKKMGYKLAVISGGFDYFTKYIQKKLGLDYQFANQLEIKDGRLTGGLVGEIVDRSKKAELLKNLANQEKIPLSQTVAVGDGANDLDMLDIAGLGVAFNAKPTVKEKAQAFISVPRIDSILYLLGISQEELGHL